ncbi:hypothetical protein AGMMS49545_02280 [Betaproteobacteria bacterium]|nr:hypothetical protein AGMMS49545_02280 [Betaproteobacteria bacterium]GHU43794.1 hypothetical protein AGMMS50289_10830 [Betaproteobacteria bacterium]
MKPEKLPPELLTEVASRLADPFEADFMGVLKSNDPLLSERGVNLETYRDLKRDAKVFSCLQKRLGALICHPWAVDPVRPGDTAASLALTRILKMFNFDQLCRDLMDAVLMGYSVSEIVWTVKDNFIVPDRIPKRRQKRFVFVDQESGDRGQVSVSSAATKPKLLSPDTRHLSPVKLHLLTANEMLKGIPVPEKKFIVHRVNPEDDNPYGMGLGLQLFWPVFFKRKGIVAWAKLCDRFGTPTVWGQFPRDAGPKEQNTLLDGLKSFSSDGVIMTPEGALISLIESRVGGNITTQEALIRAMDDYIAEVLLGQEPKSESGGALAAASKERAAVRLDLVQADSDLLSETLNRTLIAWLCEFNGLGPCTVYRQIKEEEDKKAESETDRNVSEMGFELSEEAVRAKYGEGWARVQVTDARYQESTPNSANRPVLIPDTRSLIPDQLTSGIGNRQERVCNGL